MVKISSNSEFLTQFVIFLIICIAISMLIFFMLSLRVDTSAYFDYVLKLNAQLENEAVANLINGNSLVNLPNITFITNNPEIQQQVNCQNGAIYLGPNDGSNYIGACKSQCGGAGNLIVIETEADEYFVNGTKLGVGVWCSVQPLPCNLKTGYVVASLNSYVCRPKYPNMFGGPTASNIIACNNENYSATGSQLWDYKFNVAVDPSSVIMSNEDEKLSDGTFRFRCKFGKDTNRNPYVENPLNRFHPMRNWCNKTVPAAHPDVKLRVTTSPDTWLCDCGDYRITNVKNADPDNPQSTCSACIYELTGDLQEERFNGAEITFPRTCFNINSPYTQVFTDLPCNPNNFISLTPFCDRMKFNVTMLTRNVNRLEQAMPFSQVRETDVTGKGNLKNDFTNKISW